MALPRPQAILFDVGHTLIEATPSPVEVYYKKSLEQGALNHQSEELWHTMGPLMKDLFEKRSQSQETCNDKSEWLFWKTLIDKLTLQFPPWASLDANQLLNELWDHFGHPDNWQPYPECHYVLDQLRQLRIPLAIISNWDSRLRCILQGLDLIDHFQVVSISAEIGWRKPHPHIFERTLNELNVNPKNAWHIGDSLTDDIQGAQKLGIIPFFLDRWWHPSPIECQRIKNLKELLSFLSC